MAKAKKATAFFLALAMFTFTFLSVSAQTIQATEIPYDYYGSTSDIQPRFSYFGTVSVGVSLKNGNVVGTGDYTSFANGIDVTFIIAIEKKSGSNWTQVHSTTRTYSPGKGGNILSTTYNNPPSGTYRAAATAVALNSNGNILEAIKIYSAKTVTV